MCQTLYGWLLGRCRPSRSARRYEQLPAARFALHSLPNASRSLLPLSARLTSPVGAQGVCSRWALQQERPASRFSHFRSVASHAYVRPGPRDSRRAPVCEDLARVDCSESPLTSPGFGFRRVSLRSDHSWRNR
jgi:hypothetical protein